MKKILIITDLFPDKFNPVSGVFVQHQVKELAKRYDVRVIATSFPRKSMIEQSDTHDYKVKHVYFPLVRDWYLSSVLNYMRYALPIIKSEITTWEPDIIHVHDYTHIPALFLLKKCFQKVSIPRYLTVHNIRTHPSMIQSKRFKWFYGLSFKSSYSGWTHIFTVNDRLKKVLTDCGVDSSITTIGNAVDPMPVIDMSRLDKFKQQLCETSFKILSVGNLVTEKGFDILIRSVYSLLRNNHKIQLYIIGSGPEERNLTSLVAKLHLQENVIQAGPVENYIVRNLYQYFDAFVLPSYSETFGIVYIEAMYSGLPVIGVRGQGVDGIVQHGVNGLLVNPKDETDLTEKIEYLINHKDAANEMANRGQTLVRSEYQQTQLIDKIVRIYQQ